MQKLFVILACVCILSACQRSPKNEKQQAANELTPLQSMVVTYLSYPQFVHEDFPQQVFSIPLEVVRYHPRENLLYFSIRSEVADKQEIAHISKDTSLVTFATVDSNGIYLDPYFFTEEERTYFSLPATALAIDDDIQIHTRLGEHRYQISLAEMATVFSGEMMFNGPALAQSNEKNHQGQNYIIGNHCATISPKGEPSLQRLAAQIIDSTTTREKQAQQLLDFVTREISYTGDAGMEIFRRPTEVLLSSTADCSGKTVLYASLLEQIDYPYLLVYLPQHIALAIPGDFPKKNDMHFEHEGETYYFAETTLKDFKIGRTYLSSPYREEDIEYLQYPGKATKLYDVANRDSLEFAKR